MILKHFYSNNISHKKIALLGPLSPPYGGISVHIDRVAKKFELQENIVHHFDTTIPCRKNPIKYVWSLIIFLWKFRPDQIYYHTLFLRSFCFELVILALFKPFLWYRFIIVEHNYRYLLSKGKCYKVILNLFLRGVDHQVFIGDRIAPIYDGHAIHCAPLVSIESPFLPPDTVQEQKIIERYPSALSQFIDTHSPLLIANASQVIWFNEGDLYGFDMAIQLIQQLRSTYPTVGLVFALSRIEDEAYYQQLCTEIKKRGIEQNWYFLIQNNELWPLFKHADLFVRPTSIDTFGISVQEALLMGTPAIASDVCQRPEGTILFEARNQKAFETLVISILEPRSSAVQSVETEKIMTRQ